MKRKVVKRRSVGEKRADTERHLRMSIEDWRAKKRQEWRAVVSAMEVFTYGCAYTPAGNDYYELQRAADRLSQALAEDWVPY